MRCGTWLGRDALRTTRGLLALLATSAMGCGGAAAGSPRATGEADASALSDAGPLSDGPSSRDGTAQADAASEATPAGDAGDAPPYLGGNVGPGGATFRVWAPNATAASVRGDFAATDAAMTAAPGGVFEARVPAAHAGNHYTFVLQTAAGALTREDPYCRELAPGGGCTLVDPASYAWASPPFTRAARETSVVYELHVGSFAVPGGAAQGTFDSARDALAGLADLGVNVVELMPVQDFGGGGAGWGYDPQLFFAPKPSYGTSDDLRSLVDRAHSLGIAVLVDTVINHTDAWSQAPLRCFDGDCPGGSDGIYFFPPGPYASTPWGPRPSYPDPQVSAMLVATVDAWMGEQRVDGFRWDSVSNIRAIDGAGTTPGGMSVLTRANDRVHARGGLSVAEDLKGDTAITRSVAAGGFGFDAQWDGFGYTIAGVLAPPADSARDLGAVVGALQGGYDGDGFARLIYIEDHDTVGNGGSRFPDQVDPADPTSFAARKRSMLAAALMLTAPGVPMLFMGQESLATGTFADPPAPLAAPSPAGLLVRAFYRDLIGLRRNLSGAAGGLAGPVVDLLHRDDTGKVLAYLRSGPSGQDVVVVVNLADKGYAEYDVGVPDVSAWQIRMNSDLPAYGADFTGRQTGTLTPVARTTDGKPYALPLALGPYSVMILTR